MAMRVVRSSKTTIGKTKKNSPYKPEGSFGESHKTCRCWPSPSSRTQDATRNRKSALRKMILRPSSGGNGMFEMTNENVARLLRGLTIAVGNRKNRILIYQFLAAEIR